MPSVKSFVHATPDGHSRAALVRSLRDILFRLKQREDAEDGAFLTVDLAEEAQKRCDRETRRQEEHPETPSTAIVAYEPSSRDDSPVAGMRVVGDLSLHAALAEHVSAVNYELERSVVASELSPTIPDDELAENELFQRFMESVADGNAQWADEFLNGIPPTHRTDEGGTLGNHSEAESPLPTAEVNCGDKVHLRATEMWKDSRMESAGHYSMLNVASSNKWIDKLLSKCGPLKSTKLPEVLMPGSIEDVVDNLHKRGAPRRPLIPYGLIPHSPVPICGSQPTSPPRRKRPTEERDCPHCHLPALINDEVRDLFAPAIAERDKLTFHHLWTSLPAPSRPAREAIPTFETQTQITAEMIRSSNGDRMVYSGSVPYLDGAIPAQIPKSLLKPLDAAMWGLIGFNLKRKAEGTAALRPQYENTKLVATVKRKMGQIDAKTRANYDRGVGLSRLTSRIRFIDDALQSVQLGSEIAILTPNISPLDFHFPSPGRSSLSVHNEICAAAKPSSALSLFSAVRALSQQVLEGSSHGSPSFSWEVISPWHLKAFFKAALDCPEWKHILKGWGVDEQRKRQTQDSTYIKLSKKLSQVQNELASLESNFSTLEVASKAYISSETLHELLDLEEELSKRDRELADIEMVVLDQDLEGKAVKRDMVRSQYHQNVHEQVLKELTVVRTELSRRLLNQSEFFASLPRRPFCVYEENAQDYYLENYKDRIIQDAIDLIEDRATTALLTPLSDKALDAKCERLVSLLETQTNESKRRAQVALAEGGLFDSGTQPNVFRHGACFSNFVPFALTSTNEGLVLQRPRQEPSRQRSSSTEGVDRGGSVVRQLQVDSALADDLSFLRSTSVEPAELTEGEQLILKSYCGVQCERCGHLTGLCRFCPLSGKAHFLKSELDSQSESGGDLEIRATPTEVDAWENHHVTGKRSEQFDEAHLPRFHNHIVSFDIRTPLIDNSTAATICTQLATVHLGPPLASHASQKPTQHISESQPLPKAKKKRLQKRESTFPAVNARSRREESFREGIESLSERSSLYVGRESGSQNQLCTASQDTSLDAGWGDDSISESTHLTKGISGKPPSISQIAVNMPTLLMTPNPQKLFSAPSICSVSTGTTVVAPVVSTSAPTISNHAERAPQPSYISHPRSVLTSTVTEGKHIKIHLRDKRKRDERRSIASSLLFKKYDDYENSKGEVAFRQLLDESIGAPEASDLGTKEAQSLIRSISKRELLAKSNTSVTPLTPKTPTSTVLSKHRDAASLLLSQLTSTADRTAHNVIQMMTFELGELMKAPLSVTSGHRQKMIDKYRRTVRIGRRAAARQHQRNRQATQKHLNQSGYLFGVQSRGGANPQLTIGLGAVGSVRMRKLYRGLYLPADREFEELCVEAISEETNVVQKDVKHYFKKFMQAKQLRQPRNGTDTCDEAELIRIQDKVNLERDHLSILDALRSHHGELPVRAKLLASLTPRMSTPTKQSAALRRLQGSISAVMAQRRATERVDCAVPEPLGTTPASQFSQMGRDQQGALLSTAEQIRLERDIRHMQDMLDLARFPVKILLAKAMELEKAYEDLSDTYRTALESLHQEQAWGTRGRCFLPTSESVFAPTGALKRKPSTIGLSSTSSAENAAHEVFAKRSSIQTGFTFGTQNSKEDDTVTPPPALGFRGGTKLRGSRTGDLIVGTTPHRAPSLRSNVSTESNQDAVQDALSKRPSVTSQGINMSPQELCILGARGGSPVVPRAQRISTPRSSTPKGPAPVSTPVPELGSVPIVGTGFAHRDRPRVPRPPVERRNFGLGNSQTVLGDTTQPVDPRWYTSEGSRTRGSVQRFELRAASLFARSEM